MNESIDVYTGDGSDLIKPEVGQKLWPVQYDPSLNSWVTKDTAGVVQLIGGGSLPYTSYAAVLNVGAGVPVATVLYNDTGGTIAYTKLSTGFYRLTLTGAIFTDQKTFLFIGTPNDGDFESLYGIGLNREDNNAVIINTNSIDGNASDFLLLNTAIEIRIYT